MNPDPPHWRGSLPPDGESSGEPGRGPTAPFGFRINPDYEFLLQIQQRRTPFTTFFLGVNVAIFLLMAVVGDTTGIETLVAFGAKSNPEMASGEIWRFVTPMFLHIGVLHLAFNSYALWIVGPQVERLYGSARFVIMYVATGVAGVWGSYAFNPGNISAGASGAIFGLFGVLFMFGFRNRRTVPAFLRRAIGRGVAPVIVLNLFIGFAIPVVDNAAHIGGLVCGLAMAGIVGFEQPGTRTPPVYRLGQALALATVLAAFAGVAANFERPGSTEGFIDAFNAAESAFGASARAVRRGDGNLGPAAEALGDAIAAVRRAPRLDEEGDRIMSELGDILERQYALVEELRQAGGATETGDRLIRDLDENFRRYRDEVEALYDWVRREGDEHGIVVNRDGGPGV